jgi:hypothetical protein
MNLVCTSIPVLGLLLIMHPTEIIKGFAAKASTKALENVAALGGKYIPVIEEDFIVSIDGDVIAKGHTN